MKFRLAALLVITAISLAFGPYAQPAQAQIVKEPAGYRNVTVWVNPEYDDPRLLVMMQGKITGVDAPALVRFLVPRDAEMYSAGSKDAQDKYSGGPPDRKPSQIPGWDEISYTLKTDTFRVEYYDPVISSKPDKNISYDFRSLYPISDLTVIVQEPKKSTNFTVTPGGRSFKDGEGFSAYSYNYSNQGIDKPLHFDISYTRTDTNPSLSSPSPNAKGAGSSVSGLTVGLIVGVIMAGLLVWILRSKKKAVPAAKYSSRAGQTRAAKRRNQRNRFCGKCGEPVEGSPQFCPHCGNKLGN